MPQSVLTHFECSVCSRKNEPNSTGLCDCGGTLLARYNLSAVTRESLVNVNSMWRYRAVLPVRETSSIVSLAEGMTPLLPARNRPGLMVKDEGRNPTGSSEDRVASCVASVGGALLTDPFLSTIYGESAGSATWRMEGLKTIGYEIAEQSGWNLPDAIISTVAIAAMEKAFDEMQSMGWLGSKRPRMIAPPAAPKRRLVEAGIDFARAEGILLSLEGCAALLAARSLEGRVVIVNPCSALTCLAAYQTRFPHLATSDADKLGGLITPPVTTVQIFYCL